jgi:L-amino acid N-acyltransferase YncA
LVHQLEGDEDHNPLDPSSLPALSLPLQIRPYEAADWPAVWALLEPVFRDGETFPHDPGITEEEAQVAWVEQSQAAMVAVDAAGALVGTYYLKPNSLALGAHVANAGYVVAEHCRRQGIGSRLCQHSLQAALRLGFRAMQFNLVVSTNTAGPVVAQQLHDRHRAGADAQAAQQEAPQLVQRLPVHRHRLGPAQRCFRLAEGRRGVPLG